MMKRSIARGTGLIITLAILAGVVSRTEPRYNWDLLCYVGTALSFGEERPETLHAKTLSELQQNVPSHHLSEILSEGHHSTYKQGVATNPEYFVQQLPFYSVKPAYPAMMLWVSTFFGTNLVTASIMISKVSYLAMAALLFWWLSTKLNVWLSGAATVLLMALPTALQVAGLSTPDGLSALTMLWALYLIVEHRAFRWALVPCVVSILIRPDNLVFCLLIAAYAALQPKLRIPALLAGAAGLLVYLLQTRLNESYSWATFFYHSLVERLLEPAEFESTLSLAEYGAVYGRVLGEMPQIIGWVLLGVVAILVRQRVAGNRDSWLHLLVLVSLFSVVHWFVLPVEKGRLLFAPLLFVVLSLVTTLRDSLGRRLPSFS